jgi:hypothetical protein
LIKFGKVNHTDETFSICHSSFFIMPFPPKAAESGVHQVFSSDSSSSAMTDEKNQMVDSSFKCNFENVPSLQRSEMFIAPAALINPSSVRSETYGALANPPRHCAPPERRTIGKAWDYKHLAPLEREQLPVLHFQIEFANDKWKMVCGGLS